MLLLVYAALLHGDGVAGCGGSAYVRFIDVIEAGQPMPKQVNELRADGLRRHAPRRHGALCH